MAVIASIMCFRGLLGFKSLEGSQSVPSDFLVDEMTVRKRKVDAEGCSARREPEKFLASP